MLSYAHQQEMNTILMPDPEPLLLIAFDIVPITSVSADSTHLDDPSSAMVIFYDQYAGSFFMVNQVAPSFLKLSMLLIFLRFEDECMLTLLLHQIIGLYWK